MPLPTRTVTGLYRNTMTGASQTGVVQLDPYPMVWHDNAGKEVLTGGGTVTLSAGAFSTPLATTDAAGVNPTTGRLWRLTERITDQPVRTRYFALPIGDGTPVDVTQVVVADPGPLTYLPITGNPTGPAGGALTGTYPNPTLSAFENGLSTGIMSGGELNANLSNPLALDISATVGYVVDYVTTPTNPLVTRVAMPAQTVALTNTVRTLTWWMADSAGAIIQQGTRPTNTQRRTHLQLGATALIGGVIAVDQSLPVILPQPTNQFYDLMYALGSFSIAGNDLTAAGANLQVAKSAGDVFAISFNHFAGPTLTNDPHVSSTPAQNPTSLRYATRTASPAVPAVTNVDVANYDNAGVITAIGGGTNRSTIQRVYLFPVNATANQVVVQYGQAIYNDLATAASSISSDPFMQNPTLVDGTLIGYIVATRTATDLSNTSQARFVKAAKIGTGPAGSPESLALYALLSGAAFTGPVSSSSAVLGQVHPGRHGLKAWTWPPTEASTAATATSGTLFLAEFTPAESFTSSSLHWHVSVTGVTATAGQNFVGLYASDGTLLASAGVDADVTSTAGARETPLVAALTAGASYWAAFLFNAATAPQLARGGTATAASSLTNINLSAATMRFATNGTGRTALPSPLVPASNVAGSAFFAAIE